MEKYYYFTIDNRRYCFAIVKRLFRADCTFVHEFNSKTMLCDVIPIENIRTSTLKEMVEHWLLKIRLKMIKQCGKQDR